MRVRRISMATSIFLLVSALLLVSDVFIGVIFYKKARSLLVEQMLENTKNMAATVGASVDGKDFEEAKKGDTESAEYVDDIMTKFEEMSTNVQSDIDEIKNHTSTVNDKVRESTSNINDAANKALDVTENIGDINTEAEKATCISDELSKAVGKFKVN